MWRKAIAVALALCLLIQSNTVFADALRYTESYDVRKRVVIQQRRLPYQQFKREKDMIMAQARRGATTEYPAMPEALGVVSRFVGKSDLLLSAFKDVWTATGADTFKFEGQENLNDSAKRREFWKQQGIYDKYTPGEIAFINKVVFPAVAAARGAEGVGGVALLAGAASALLGAAFLPALGLGVGAMAAVTAVKAWHLKHTGQDIASTKEKDAFNYGLAAPVIGVAAEAGAIHSPWVVGGLEAASGAVQGGAALAGVGVLGMTVAGGGLAIDAMMDAARLANAWGIPDEEGRPPIEIPPTTPGSEPQLPSIELDVRYRLTK